MKDRQFMVMLGLVVAAGLVMGLIAFRVTSAPVSSATSAPATNTAATGGRPSSPSEDAGQPVQPEEQPDTADVDSGEPRAPKVEAPEMKPPSSGDAPGTAAVEPGQSGTAQPTAGDSVQ